MVDIEITSQVCDYCYNEKEDLKPLTEHLLDKRYYWKGGFTPEKLQEYNAIVAAYKADKLTPCMVLDSEHGIYICKKHLQEVLLRM